MYGKTKGTRPGSTTGEDLKATFRFHTDIQATGSFRPGEPIRLAVNVRANLPTQNAEVKLFLPEIQALQNKQAGQPATIPVGQPLKPQVSWNRSFSKGQVFGQRKTVTVKQSGYYHAS